LRNDSLVGLADFAWDSTGPQAFTVAWLAADSFEVRIHGERSGSQLIISGTRDTTYNIPSLPWAVADYGMEEHIVPMLRRLPISDGIQRVAVYRPYGGQWDTLSLVLSAAEEGSIRVREAGDKDTTLWVIDHEGSLLQLTRAQSQGERRPLEKTPLYAAYRRLRFMPFDLK
jgi:hypothetical protein